jgi:hypothetical protein
MVQLFHNQLYHIDHVKWKYLHIGSWALFDLYQASFNIHMNRSNFDLKIKSQ